MSLSMAAAQAVESRLRYVSPHAQSARSAAAPASGTTMGRPHAIASAMPRPKVSQGEPCTNASALANAPARRARSRSNPAKRTPRGALPKGFEHHVPALFHGKTPRSNEEQGAFVRVAQPLAPPFVSACPRVKDARIDAERRVNHARHARRAELLDLLAARRKRGIEGSQEGPHALPQRRGRRACCPLPDPFGQGGFDVSADVIRVPKRGSQTRGAPSARHDRGGGEVRRMGFQHVRPLGANPLANLVDAMQQVVRAVVRERRPCEPHEPRRARPRCGDRTRRSVLVARTRGDDRVAVPLFGKQLTPRRQMASDAAAPVRIEFGYVDNLETRSLIAKATRFCRPRARPSSIERRIGGLHDG